MPSLQFICPIALTPSRGARARANAPARLTRRSCLGSLLGSYTGSDPAVIAQPISDDSSNAARSLPRWDQLVSKKGIIMIMSDTQIWGVTPAPGAPPKGVRAYLAKLPLAPERSHAPVFSASHTVWRGVPGGPASWIEQQHRAGEGRERRRARLPRSRCRATCLGATRHAGPAPL